MKRYLKHMSLLGIVLCATACGGGSSGSSSEGTTFRGRVSQGHFHSNPLAHAPGEVLSGIEVSALGSVSVTDRFGRWEFSSASARDEAVLFTFKGHGADASIVFEIPLSAQDVEINADIHTRSPGEQLEAGPTNDLVGPEVTISRMLIDGEEVHSDHSDDHDDHDHDDHDDDHDDHDDDHDDDDHEDNDGHDHG